MFGFARPQHPSGAYRRVYASLCACQHRNQGIESLPFLSYEAVLLYLALADAGLATFPPEDNPTCCRLATRPRIRSGVDQDLARFCGAFGLLLASIKLEDDVRDDHSLVARLVRWRLHTRIERASLFFNSLDASFQGTIQQAIDDHLQLEQRVDFVPLDQYVAPTARAFGYVFGLAASLRTSPSKQAVFESLGQHVGAALIAFDCAADWRRDRARGRFNPLPGFAAVKSALAYSQRRLAMAGWLCRDNFPSDSMRGELLSVQVLRSTFDHLIRRAAVGQQPSQRTIAPIAAGRRGLAMVRGGFCDCDCGGCDCPCDGSVADSCCCGNGHHDCCGGCLGECCWCGNANQKKRKASTKPVAEADSQLTGMRGTTVGPLNPAGVVSVGSKQIPAKSETGLIEDGTEVEVIVHDAFGVIVRRVTDQR